MVSRRTLARFLLVTTALCAPALAVAQVVASDPKTQVYTAPNGVTVVDIAKANAEGLSHNKFDQYNVPANGIVLNNANRDALTRESQLAGSVTANLNLDKEARVILNEVTGANRSILAGYTEVVGRKADVIVANPYGITCNGCGFINAPTATLTTGRPVVDADGRLRGYSVTTGDVLVTGRGLNATAQDYLALVARTVKLDAQVNARALDVIAGVNDVDRDTVVVTARKAADAAPEYAIDATVLGGMYAGRIRLIATEAGVGVRALGEVAASAADFTLDAAGKVLLAGKVSAANDVRLATGGATLALQQAALTATRDLSVTAAAGTVTLTGGTLVAGRDLTIAGATLSDASDAGDVGRRVAGGALTVTSSGATTIGAASYGGASATFGSGGDFAASGATLYSGAGLALRSGGALALGNASVRAATGLTIDASGLLSTAAGATQGVVADTGTVAITAGGVDHRGTISADAGMLTLASSAAIGNAGTLHAATTLTLGGTGAGAVDVRNDGLLLADGGASVTAAALTNAGTLQSGVAGSIAAAAVRNAGTLTLGAVAGDGTITTADLRNAATGIVQSTGALEVRGLDTFDNAGALLATRGVVLSGTGTLANRATGTIQAGTTLTVSGAALDNAGLATAKGATTLTLATLSNGGALLSGGDLGIGADTLTNAGRLVSDGRVTLTAATIANSGTIQAGGALDATLREALDNGGRVIADGGLTIAAATPATRFRLGNEAGAFLQSKGALSVDGAGAVTNLGTIVAGTTLDMVATDVGNGVDGKVQGTGATTLTLDGTLTNDGLLIAGFDAGSGGSIAARRVANNGRLQSGGALSLSVAEDLRNAGKLLANGALSIAARDAATVLAIGNGDGAYIQSMGALGIAGTAGARNARIVAQTGYLIGDSAVLTLGDIDNAGVVQTSGALTIDSDGLLTNAGTVLAQGALTLGARDVSNRGTMQGTSGAGVTVGTLDNRGTLIGGTGSDGMLTIGATGVSNAGTIQSGGAAALSVGGTLSNAGKLIAGRTLTLNARDAGTAMTLSNAAGAVMQAGTALTVGDATRRVRAGVLAGQVLAQDATLTFGGDVTTGAWVQTDRTLTVDAGGLLTNRGTLYAKQTVAVSAGEIRNAGGAQVQGTQGGTVTSAGALRNDGTMILGLDSGADGAIGVRRLDNAGTLQSAGNLRVDTREGVVNDGTLYAARDLRLGALAGADRLTIRNRRGATMQSDGRLTIDAGAGVPMTLTFDEGKVLAQALDVRASSLDNAGTIQTERGAAFRLDGDFVNSGVVLTQDQLTLAANAITNRASGQIEAVAGSRLTAAALTNDGAFYLASGEGRSADVRVAKLVNSGTLLGNGAVTLTTATALSNGGSIGAKGDVRIRADGAGTLTIDNDAGATIQSGGALSIRDTTAGAVAFAEQAGTLWGKTVDLAMATLTNTGTLRSDGDATLAFTGAFTNQTGRALFATSGAGVATITAGGIANGNVIQSEGAMSLKLGSGGLSNGKTLVAVKDLTITGTAGDFAIGGGGRFQSGSGTLAIDGGDAALTLGLNSIVYGKTVTLDLRSLTLNGDGSQNPVGGAITAEGDLTITTGTLAITAANAAIMGNVRATGAAIGTGRTSLTVAGTLSNPGFIFSGAQLSVSAANIANRGGGGINALGKATLTSGGYVVNSGDIYTAGGLDVVAAGQTITNYGAIRSDGTMSFQTGTFTNRAEVAAKGSITVSAATFANTIGDDPRSFGAASTGLLNMPETKSDYYSGWEGDSPGDVAVPNMQGGSHTEGDTRYYHSGTYVVEDTLNVPRSSIVRPRMVADGDLSIADFQSATNFGGILSARTFQLTGAGSTSTFVNDAVVMYKSTHTVSYQDYNDCAGAVSLNCVLHAKLGYSDAVTSRVQQTGDNAPIGASIYAINLDVKAFRVDNIASTVAADGGAARDATGSAAGVVAATGSAAALQQIKEIAGNGGTGSGAGAIATVSGSSGAGAIAGADLRDYAAVKAALATTGVGGATTVAGQPAVAYPGVVVTLPGGINGQYVVSRDPTASYLVETNPRFGLGGSVGSDFMAKRLGVNVDLLARRLGDAAYEAYLIAQQVAAQVGTAKLVQAETSDEQVQRLMTNGVAAAGALGLDYGKPLSPGQQATLDTDMVWMVETEVAGQKVLAPVVYVSAKTRALFAPDSATMHATEAARFDVGTLTNSGGTIGGDRTLAITASGDVTNTSGTINGGNVSVTSTGGSIINQTYGSTTGGDGNRATVIGKQAGITATGGLTMDAAKDITVTGATVSAGTDASLKAGNNITFGTVDDVSSTSRRGKDSYNETTTTTQHGSALTVGGNLSLDSGKDTTFTASQATVAGNAAVKTGGDLNIVAGQNSTSSHDESTRSGMGVGGGVYGTEKTTTDEFHGRNVASGFTVGGNATIDAGGDMNVKGSTVAIGGDADVRATSVNILQGNDVDTSSSTTETTTYLRTGAATKSEAGTNKGARASAGGYSAQASAEVGATASNKNEGNLELMNHTTTTTDKESSRAVGSAFTVGGDARVTATKDVTLQGSELNVGKDVSVDARNINLLAAENKETSTTTSDSHSLGFMVDNENKAEASAGAAASASFTAQAKAEAKAAAESDTTVDLYRNTQSTTKTTDITHTGSAIKSGGNTALSATNQLTVEGSAVEAGGDLGLKAKDMTFKEVNDVHETTTTQQQSGVGLYVNGNAEAKAGAEANITGANVGASAGAEAGAGVQVSHTSGEKTEGSTTAVVSSLKSGGNMTRTAEGKITDVGTAVEAGGDFAQSATSWDSKAAADTSYSSSKEQSDKGRVGVYADAEAGATAGASVTGKGTGADADASVGAKVTFEHENSSATENSSTARVGTIKSGGKFTSTTTEKTALEGTRIDAGGDAALTAGSLDYTAARDTHSSTSDSTKVEAEVKAGISATKAVKAEGSVGYQGSEAQSAGSKAVAGGITSGGNLNVVTTKGDANLEGTNLKAAGNGSIESAGAVNFTAARDIESSSATKQDASVGVSLSKGGGSTSGGVEVGGGFEHQDADTNKAQVGSFVTGGTMSVNAKGGDATLEGTKLNAGGDTALRASGDVTMKAAESTESSHAYGAQLSLSGEASKKDKPAAKDAAPARSDAAPDGAWTPAKPTKGGDGGGAPKPGTGDAGTPAKPAGSTPGDAGKGNAGGDKPKPVIGQRGQTGDAGGTPSDAATSTRPGDAGKGDAGGEKPKPVIGQRGQTGDAGGTPSDATPSSRPGDAGKGDAGGDKPKPVIGQRGQTGDAGGTTGEAKSPGTPAGKPVETKAAPAPGEGKKDAADGAQPAGEGATPGGWVKARPTALGPEAAAPEEEKPEKGGGVGAGVNYESKEARSYTGSDVASGGTLTVQAGGDVTRQNVTTKAAGGTTTTAGGTVSDTKKQDSKTIKAGGGGVEVKTTSANTSTGTADNAGQTGP